MGIIRLSGPESVAIAEKVYGGRGRLAQAESHTIHYGKVVEPQTQKVVDEALFMLMRAPHSFTGEDVLEIQCHGGISGHAAHLGSCAGGGCAFGGGWRIQQAGFFERQEGSGAGRGHHGYRQRQDGAGIGYGYGAAGRAAFRERSKRRGQCCWS